MTQMKYQIVLCRAEQESEPGKVFWARNKAGPCLPHQHVHVCGTLNAVSSEWWIYELTVPARALKHTYWASLCLWCSAELSTQVPEPCSLAPDPWSLYIPKSVGVSPYDTHVKLENSVLASLGDTGSSWYLWLTRVTWNRGQSLGTGSVSGGNMKGEPGQHRGGLMDLSGCWRAGTSYTYLWRNCESVDGRYPT